MIRALAGENSFALNSELRKIVTEFYDKFGSTAIEKIDCEETEYNKITGAVSSVTFLSSKKMVVLYKPSAQKEFVENLDVITELIPDSTDVVIVEPKPDKRTSYFKHLKKLEGFRYFDEIGEAELAGWSVSRSKELGGEISLADANYLIQRAGPNQQLVNNELKKLVSYSSEVTRQSIDLLVEQSLTSTVFQLIDAALAGNTSRAIKLYKEQRAQKVEPLAIVGMLGWQLNIMATVKTAGDKSQAVVAKEAGINPFVAQKSAAAAKKIRLAELKKLISELVKIDIKLKSTGMDPDEALENYLLDLSGAATV